MHFKSTFCVGLVAFSLTLASVWGIEISHAQDHVLVLSNGNTLSGQVTKTGTQFEVRTRSSRLIIEQNQVDFVCNTLADAYELKFADTAPDDIEGQQRLFHWCIRNRLWQQAENQIATVQMTDANPEIVEHLRRQLTVQMEQVRKRNEPRERVAEARSSPNAPPVGQFDPNAGRVRQVGHTEVIDINPLPGPGRVAKQSSPDAAPVMTELQQRMALQREMEEQASNLPKGVVGKYKRQIESNLIVGCYAASCHNTEQVDMPLMVIGRYKSVPKRMSQRNLHAVLKHVDFEDPLQSQLFLSATTAHGGEAKPPFSEGMVEHGNLKRWLLMLATPQAIARYQAKELETQQQLEMQTRKQESQADLGDGMGLPGEIRQVSAAIPVDTDLPSIPDLKPASVFVPRDPFDPEIFNRKYRDPEDSKRQNSKR